MHIANRSILLAFLIGASAIAGCGGDSDSPSKASGTGDSSSGSERTSSSSSVRSSSSSEEPATNTVDLSDAAQCITNDWVLISDQVEQLFAGGPLGSLPNFTVNVTGNGPVTFKANGTYHYAPDFDVTITAGEITGTGHWGGTLDGTWAVEGDQLSMAQTDNHVTGSISIMGREVAMPTNKTFNGTSTITDCQPDTLTTSLETPLGTVVQTLVPA